MKSKKNNLVKSTLVLFAALIALVHVNFTFAHDGDGGSECETKQCRKDLATARAATAKYHDINVALEEGFVPVSPCVSVPGLGAMGIHYANFSRFNLFVDPAEPEILLYLPGDDGEMRLVGLEYAAIFIGSNSAPTLFGQTMQGPVSRGGPFQYELHVWAWRNNPSGVFAPFNPKLQCP